MKLTCIEEILVWSIDQVGKATDGVAFHDLRNFADARSSASNCARFLSRALRHVGASLRTPIRAPINVSAEYHDPNARIRDLSSALDQVVDAIMNPVEQIPGIDASAVEWNLGDLTNTHSARTFIGLVARGAAEFNALEHFASLGTGRLSKVEERELNRREIGIAIHLGKAAEERLGRPETYCFSGHGKPDLRTANIIKQLEQIQEEATTAPVQWAINFCPDSRVVIVHLRAVDGDKTQKLTECWAFLVISIDESEIRTLKPGHVDTDVPRGLQGTQLFVARELGRLLARIEMTKRAVDG